MQRYLFFFLLIGSVFSSKAQSNAAKFDPEKYMHNIAYADHKITFQAQPIKKQLSTVDPDKSYYWFAAGEIHVTQGSYSGKLLHGVFTDYYLNGQLKEQGHFDLGLKDGEWNMWTADGSLISKINYKAGIADGPYFKYGNDGKLVEEGYYNNAQTNGKLKTLNDSTWVTTNYKNGVAVVPKARPEQKSWFKRLFSKKEKTTSENN